VTGPDWNVRVPIVQLEESAMISKRATAIGSILVIALAAAPFSGAFASDRHHGGYGHRGHGGHAYGYGFNPVVGLATALVGAAAAIVTAPIAILAAVANAPYYGPGPNYPVGPAGYGAPPVAQGHYGAPAAPGYYATPQSAPPYYGPPARAYYRPTATPHYAPPAATYYGPPGRGPYGPPARGNYRPSGGGYATYDGYPPRDSGWSQGQYDNRR
jgi:hypothetical protein